MRVFTNSMIRGTAAADARTQELALLAGLSDRRAAFQPACSTKAPGVPDDRQ